MLAQMLTVTPEGEDESMSISNGKTLSKKR
jgi:hypothetical protein